MTLAELATRLLNGFAEQLSALDVSLPERRYVAPGSLVPFDGEQLVVNLQDIIQGTPGAPNPGTFVPGTETLHAEFAVSLVRVVNTLSSDGGLPAMLPTEEAMGEDGAVAMTDSMGLVQAAIQLHAQSVVTGLGMGFAVGPCSPLGPEGGMAATRILVQITLGGP